MAFDGMPKCRWCHHTPKGVNFELCRACELAIWIALQRARASRHWLNLKRAIKEEW